MTRNFFIHEMSDLKKQLIEMSQLVANSIDNSILALKNIDVNLTKTIFENEKKIDNFEHEIEKHCLELIAKQQPIASDLRNISTILKVITDLERIADHSSDIAEIIVQLEKIKQDHKIPKELFDMASVSKDMVYNSINSFINQDLDLAYKVCSTDDDVDNYFEEIILKLTELMKEDTDKISICINLIFIVKYIERIADHATNISEWVVFNITGNHEHLASQLHKKNN